MAKSGLDLVGQRTGVAGGIYRLFGSSFSPPASLSINLAVSARGRFSKALEKMPAQSESCWNLSQIISWLER